MLRLVLIGASARPRACAGLAASGSIGCIEAKIGPAAMQRIGDGVVTAADAGKDPSSALDADRDALIAARDACRTANSWSTDATQAAVSYAQARATKLGAKSALRRDGLDPAKLSASYAALPVQDRKSLIAQASAARSMRFGAQHGDRLRAATSCCISPRSPQSNSIRRTSLRPDLPRPLARAPRAFYVRSGNPGAAPPNNRGMRRMSDTADRVKKIVVEHLGVEAASVTPEASFIDDLGADSLDIVELVMAFEEEFGVEIPDDAAEKISTVNDAITYIDANQG